MNRKHQLQFCKQCENQVFVLEKGIVCSLTNEQASFEINCKDYKEDPIEKQKMDELRIQAELNEIEEETLGLSSFGIKNGVIAGQITILGAILWLVLGVIYMDSIFFYPFFLIIIGVIVWRKGIKRKEEDINRLN